MSDSSWNDFLFEKPEQVGLSSPNGYGLFVVTGDKENPTCENTRVCGFDPEKNDFFYEEAGNWCWWIDFGEFFDRTFWQRIS